MTIVMKAWFRAISAAFRSEAAAQTVAGLSILALSIYTGRSYLRSPLTVDKRTRFHYSSAYDDWRIEVDH